MTAPSLELIHLKTSKQHKKGTLVTRYWFEWQNRRRLGAIVLRLELLDESGTSLTEVSFKLPKVKITGYLPATDSRPQKPVYDSTIYIKLDDIVRDVLPVSFRYYTPTKMFI